jgi:timeless
VSNPFKDPLSFASQAKRKRGQGRRRKGAFRVGLDCEGLAMLLQDGSSLSSQHASSRDPLTLAAHRGLHRLACGLLDSAYEPLVKSIKHEFRMETMRLRPHDRPFFYRMARFFMAFARYVRAPTFRSQQSMHATSTHARHACRSAWGRNPRTEWVRSLLQNMDVLSFNLVLEDIKFWIEQDKEHVSLAHAVSLYKEMLLLLEVMARSSDQGQQQIAVGLQVRCDP